MQWQRVGRCIRALRRIRWLMQKLIDCADTGSWFGWFASTRTATSPSHVQFSVVPSKTERSVTLMDLDAFLILRLHHRVSKATSFMLWPYPNVKSATLQLSYHLVSNHLGVLSLLIARTSHFAWSGILKELYEHNIKFLIHCITHLVFWLS